MKLLRLAVIVVLALGVLVGGAAIALLANQDRIMAAVLKGVEERTGYHITTGATHIRLSSHLILEFEHPDISHGGRSLVKLDAFRAVVSYHSMLFSGGMPLYSVMLVRPEFQLPHRDSFNVNTPFPRIGTELVDTILKLLNGLEHAAWRIETTDAKIYNEDGTVLFDQLGVLAFRRHRQSQVWRAEFGVHVEQPPFQGMRVTGRLRVGTDQHRPNDQIAGVSMWYWNEQPSEFVLSTASFKGRTSGSVTFSLAEDGTAHGMASVGVVGLQLSAKDSSPPENLGDFTFEAKFSESPDTMQVEKFKLVHEQTVLANGDAALTGLAEQKPVVTAHVTSGVPLDVATIRSHLRFFRNVPGPVVDAVNRVQSGRLRFSSIALATTPEKLEHTPDAAIRDGIDITAILENLRFSLPQDLKLPDVQNLSAQLRYAHNTMSATQGSATLDQSSFSEVQSRFDFAKNFDALAYQLSFNFDASLAQLYPALMSAMARYKVDAAKQVQSLGGRLIIRTSASGSFKLADPVPPATYRASFEANRATFMAKGTPGPIEFTRGSVTLEPGRIRFAKLALKTTGGDGLVDGTLGFDNSGVHVRDITVELHDMPAGLWMAMAIDPDSIKVDGPIGGKVRLHTDSGQPGGLMLNGKLVLRTGSVLFGFLRAPLIVQGTTINFDGRSISIAMSSSTLEGSPIDFRMSIADVGKPSLRLDVNVAKLDFEVMKFIRLPWSPATPPTNFPIPVTGHIEAAQGNLSKLQMSQIKTDFWRINGDWKVYNYTANAFNGSAQLEITGRAKDDVIHIQAKTMNMDIGGMFLMSGDRTESPIVGKTWIAADIWADTNNNFFETMNGRAAITVRDGMLHKFKLLSRMLSMIDLKSWLTAKVDPTIEGLPFDTVFLDLNGDKGVFNTENFLLEGPVMAITAEGQLNLVNTTMDMKVAAFPLSTFNWVLSKIPVIGGNVAGAAGTVVAAYFHAHGPVSDPSVTPMPITSFAEIIKKFFAMPVNVIKPNTVK